MKTSIQAFTANFGFDSTNHRDFFVGRFENMINQGGSSSFAISAGHPNDFQVIAGIAVETRGQKSDRQVVEIVDEYLRYQRTKVTTKEMDNFSHGGDYFSMGWGN